jgi:hypothetical protein
MNGIGNQVERNYWFAIVSEWHTPLLEALRLSSFPQAIA